MSFWDLIAHFLLLLNNTLLYQFSSVAQSCPTLCDPMQHARLPCPSPTPGAYSNSCPLSWWCHPIISSSVVPFSSHLQSFLASWSFPVSQFFTSGGQSIGVLASASVPPMNIQDWFPLGWTGWISLQSKGLSRVFSNTTSSRHWEKTFCPTWKQEKKFNLVHTCVALFSHQISLLFLFTFDFTVNWLSV